MRLKTRAFSKLINNRHPKTACGILGLHSPAMG